jgi:isoleucyl-tRNA synthetase
LRFLLGNLSNLSQELTEEKHLEKELNLVDYYILDKLEKLTLEAKKNYEQYSFNSIYSSLLNFCINDLSAFYFEINKDSLYCDSIDSQRRKQITTTLYYLLQGLLKIISPSLPYLAEEVYRNIPFRFGFASSESVFLANYSRDISFLANGEKKINLIRSFFLPIRQDVYRALEKSRQEKIIDVNSQAHLTIYLKEEKKSIDSELDLRELLLVAEVEIKYTKKQNDIQKSTNNSYF